MTAQEPMLRPEQKPIIAKAFYRAAESLEMTRHEISEILGISEPTISRHLVAQGEKSAIELDDKRTEIALFFLRVYRSLFALFGNNETNARLWFNAHNHALNGIPRQLVKKIGGLINVAEYLDAMRGKI